MQNKIICTLGPSSFNTNVLKNLKKCGVFIFRINMSHTNINELEKKILFLKKNKIKIINNQTPWQELSRLTVGQLEDGACIKTRSVYNRIVEKKGTPRHSH